MPEKALRLVLSFDAKAQTFNPAGHNLPLTQAGSFADELKDKQGLTCLIVEQKTKHKAGCAEGCNPCKKAALAERRKRQKEQKSESAETASKDVTSEISEHAKQ